VLWFTGVNKNDPKLNFTVKWIANIVLPSEHDQRFLFSKIETNYEFVEKFDISVFIDLNSSNLKIFSSKLFSNITNYPTCNKKYNFMLFYRNNIIIYIFAILTRD